MTLDITRETYRDLVPVKQPALVQPEARHLSEQRIVDAARVLLEHSLADYWIEYRSLPSAAVRAELRNEAWMEAVRRHA